MYPDNKDDILKGLNNLATCMENMLKKASEMENEEIDPDAMVIHFKLVKQLIFQVDNSLGDIQDFLDTMEYYQDEKYAETKKLVIKVEDLTTELIAYLRKHNQY